MRHHFRHPQAMFNKGLLVLGRLQATEKPQQQKIHLLDHASNPEFRTFVTFWTWFIF
jgi:hypothetical protein